MRDTKSCSAGKRVFFGVLRVYAGLCTLLVTAVLALILWEVISTQSTSAEGHPNQVTSAETESKAWDLRDVVLSYDLPKVPSTFERSFQRHGADVTASQPDGAAGGSLPVVH